MDRRHRPIDHAQYRGVVLACLRRKRDLTDRQRALRFFLQLTLFGLLLFLMLFEARSRYLFLYLPYFCALGAIGYSGRFPHRKRINYETE